MKTKWLLPAMLFTLLLLGVKFSKPVKSKSEDSVTPEVYYVLHHSPGKNWVKDRPFFKQPEISRHAEYMEDFLESDQLLKTSTFTDNTGALMILAATNQQEAESIAFNDPCVKSGLLKVSVKPWKIALNSDRK
ncbi:YciI family protein [Adhaeribacter soli]|uniref:YCII-related domain-containing protein n=1 Tax=Adhaeribacter soli TaxID=2607655 RepID=A0A5N1J5K3_9BACT|nr:YciI family protein [Adhaeribacter soli]KAA9346007.1 hypothetical protein F0P94_02705 [Adhaeribacter soli]